MVKNKVISTGRRKTAVARVRLIDGNGKISINKRTLENYFPRQILRQMVKQPLKVCDSLDKFDFIISVRGGGISGQAGAVRHGIARALLLIDPNNRRILKKNRLLTRDPRMVERKKYGQSGARKRFQFSKR